MYCLLPGTTVLSTTSVYHQVKLVIRIYLKRYCYDITMTTLSLKITLLRCIYVAYYYKYMAKRSRW